MGLLECTSYRSLVRGYDYFKEGKVQDLVQIAQNQYRAAVSGTAARPYEVLLDLNHVRKSKCTCPHANGKRIVCKHMVSVYFSIFPDEAQHVYETKIADKYDDMEYDERDEYEYEDGYEYEDENDESDELIKYVCKMTRSELQQTLLQLLIDGPSWQYERFIEEHYIGWEI